MKHHNMIKVYAPGMTCIYKGAEWVATDLHNYELNQGNPPGSNDMWRRATSL